MSEEKKPTVDWDLLEVHFRAGIKTLEQLGKEFGVTKGRISQVAKKNGWTRDLRKKIEARTQEKLNEIAVNKELNKERVCLEERVVVEATSNLQVSVIQRHKASLQRLGDVKEKLLTHVESVVDNLGDLPEVIEMVRNPDDNGVDKANDMMRKVLGRSAVVDDLKRLAEIDEKIRKGEREAFGLDKEQDDGKGGIESLLERIGSAV